MFAAVYAPDFPLQAALRLEPELWERSVAVVDDKSSRIISLSSWACRAGILLGMTPAQALARDAMLLIRPRSCLAETTAQRLLILMTSHQSPYIENTMPGVVTIDLRPMRMAHPEAWAPQLIEQLAAMHLRVQVGIAPNPMLAFQAARLAKQWHRIETAPGATGEGRTALAELPVEILALSEEKAGLLRDWGIRTLGQLQALPRAELAQRWGEEGTALWDQAMGRAERVLRLVRPEEVYRETIELEYGVETLEPLLFLIRRALEQVLLQLEAAWLMAAELELKLFLDNGTQRIRRFSIPCPTRDPELLFRVLFTYLETQQTDAPLVGFALEAFPSPAPNHQFGLFETALRDPNRFFETLARLRVVAGNDRVGSPMVRETHRPDAVEVEEPGFLQEMGGKPGAAPYAHAIGPVLRRYRPPVPAIVISREMGEPSLIESSEVSGSIMRVLGPWHGMGDWWDASPWEFEEWDVELQGGGLYRIARGRDGWSVVGEYD